MAIEVTPLGVKCNIQCQYCYQNPIRDAGNVPRAYDLPAIRDALTAEGAPFSLFGGEPLLMRRADLEELWSWGFERYGRNAVQTNGTLVDADFIRMFKAYNVHVGMSLDGPEELNDARWAGSSSATRRSTRKAQDALELMCREGIVPSLIITLTRVNAAPERLDRLEEWIAQLEQLGVRRVRLHVLESESAAVRARYALTGEQNTEALLRLARFERTLTSLRFDLFRDMRNLLLGQDQHSTCVWTGCDPYTTRAVSGITGTGERTNCSRTNKDGIDYLKAGSPGYERYIALYLTPQAAGGCQGCRFFLMCKGQCPGTALDGDWRNRSEHCETWKAVYEAFETRLTAQGREPLSLSPRRATVERQLIDSWARGQNVTVASLAGTGRAER